MTTAKSAIALGYSRRFRTGEVIFHEKERGNAAYVVRSGVVEIVKNAGHGSEVSLAECGQGSIFGEMALIDDAPRSATARVKSDVELLVVPKERFRKILQEADPFLRGLVRILVSNMRQTSNSMTTFYSAMEDLRGALECEKRATAESERQRLAAEAAAKTAASGKPDLSGPPPDADILKARRRSGRVRTLGDL